MPFPRLYDTIACKLDGYEAYTVRLLLNPTSAERVAWFAGFVTAKDDLTALALACVAVYGETQTAGLDFSTPAAARATLEQSDIPDELLSWLFLLPGEVWDARGEQLKKTLMRFLTTPTS